MPISATALSIVYILVCAGVARVEPPAPSPETSAARDRDLIANAQAVGTASADNEFKAVARERGRKRRAKPRASIVRIINRAAALLAVGAKRDVHVVQVAVAFQQQSVEQAHGRGEVRGKR